MKVRIEQINSIAYAFMAFNTYFKVAKKIGWKTIIEHNMNNRVLNMHITADPTKPITIMVPGGIFFPRFKV